MEGMLGETSEQGEQVLMESSLTQSAQRSSREAVRIVVRLLMFDRATMRARN